VTDATLLRWLRVSAVLALVGLAFFVWSLVDPSPIPVIVAMSVGQGIGTLSFLLFVLLILLDIRRGGRRAAQAEAAARAQEAAPAPPAAPPGDDA
jgi:hypothetical protein